LILFVYHVIKIIFYWSI